MLRIATIFAAMFFTVTSATAEETAISDVKQIEQVLEIFSTAIIEKNEEAMLSLFLRDDAPFVTTNPSNIDKEADVSTVRRFITFVTGSERNLRERFYDVEINVFETTATLTSRYDFSIDGKVSNDGYEVWSLLKTKDGWKIISVIWSTNLRGDN